MRPRFVILLAALAALAFMASCGNEDPATSPTSLVTEPDTTTPRDNQEAEEAALWLSGELLAPQALYETIRDDLAAIRGEFLDSIPDVAISFRTPWVISEVIVLFTDEARDRFLAREPNDVDSLNAVFHATHLDTFRLNVKPYWTLIDFEGRMHPDRLGEVYQAQDDIIWGESNGWIGDWSNVYPWKQGAAMTYLFRHGEGDCPAGCIDNVFWYFRRLAGKTEFVGTYDYWNDPEPVWWKEAKTAFEYYRMGN
jgi:hypothetical protein